MPSTQETGCCSLVQIRASNNATAKQITTQVNIQKKARRHAAFVITTPTELQLVETLRGLDFWPVTEFKRCNASGLLTMWVKRF